jgi:hypothetical protein
MKEQQGVFEVNSATDRAVLKLPSAIKRRFAAGWRRNGKQGWML